MLELQLFLRDAKNIDTMSSAHEVCVCACVWVCVCMFPHMHVGVFSIYDQVSELAIAEKIMYKCFSIKQKQLSLTQKESNNHSRP